MSRACNGAGLILANRFQSIDSTPRAGHDYLYTVAIIAACTGLVWLGKISGLTDANGAMLYLAAVAFIAARLGRTPAILATMLSVLCFPFFFHQPIFGFTKSDTQYLVMLAVLLAIGVLISELTARLKTQLSDSQQREHRTSQLYGLTLELNGVIGEKALVNRAGEYICEALNCDLAITCVKNQHLETWFESDKALAAEPGYEQIVASVLRDKIVAGCNTSHYAKSSIFYVPMIGLEKTLGVVAARPRDRTAIGDPVDQQMLATGANLLAFSIERDKSRADAQSAQVQVHAEQIRNSLLSSVSHDLRTPLATISVGASSVLQSHDTCLDDVQRENLETVVSESARLTRQVDNLLEMAQLTSGSIVLKCEWHILDELVGVALTQLKGELRHYEIEIDLPAKFPMVWVADELFVKVLVNILDNAVRYCPAGSRLKVHGDARDAEILVRISDNGPGLPASLAGREFDRFVRGSSAVADGRRGVGLGLAICRAIVELHNGHITCQNLSGGGAEFEIALPRAPK